MATAVSISPEHPVLIDKFLEDAIEVDVDAVCDGEDVYIGAVMQHVEEAGVHSGDSACVIPSISLGEGTLEQVRKQTRALALGLGVRGLINVQFAYQNYQLYVLEVNPRGSRTVPFVSKATGVPMAQIATRVILGERLSDMGLERRVPEYVSVKEAVLPFSRFPGSDTQLGPEMKSTGEVMGIAEAFPAAFGKAMAAAGMPLPTEGNVFLSVCDSDKSAATILAQPAAVARVHHLRDQGHGDGAHQPRHPRQRGEQGVPGRAQRGQPHRERPDRPRGQHAVRPRGARRRLRDPHHGAAQGRGLHHHAGRRVGGGLRDRSGEAAPRAGTLPAGPARGNGVGMGDAARAHHRRPLPVGGDARTAGSPACATSAPSPPSSSSRRGSPAARRRVSSSWSPCPAAGPCCAARCRCSRRTATASSCWSRRAAPAPSGSRSSRWGTSVDLAGPLGSAFPTDGVTNALLVGGGIGCAPLQYLADELAAAGASVTAAFGFRDFRAARAAGAFSIDRLWVATEDGSVGRAGTVLHLLAALDVPPGTTVYACGPTPMIAAVQQWTFAEGLRGYVSLEAHMACGTGSCHGCVVDTARGKLRVCSEGPVFRLDEVTP